MLFGKGEREIIPYIIIAIGILCFFIRNWIILTIYSFLMFMMLSVPCGIKQINKDKPLWIARQLAFLILAIGFLIQAVWRIG